MARNSRPWDDARVESAISLVLRIGVTAATIVTLIGGGLYLVRHGGEPFNYRVFRGEPGDLRSVDGIIGDALIGRARGLIQFGLLLLIATPVARVAFSIVAFSLQRDRLYVAITAFVMAVLAFSLAGGRL